MRKNTAGLVALVVLAVATLLMIFVVLPNVGDDAVPTVAEGTSPAKPPATVEDTPGALPGNGDTTTVDAKGNRPGAGDAASGTSEPAPVPSTQPSTVEPNTVQPNTVQLAPSGDPAPAETADGTDAPRFDVLRVEPDGSTVIAGRAEPNSKLEIVNGNAVVGTADVGNTGDFAAVFDKPLPPGDYQLTLRSTTPSGAVTASDEVATVSIPKVDNRPASRHGDEARAGKPYPDRAGRAGGTGNDTSGSIAGCGAGHRRPSGSSDGCAIDIRACSRERHLLSGYPPSGHPVLAGRRIRRGNRGPQAVRRRHGSSGLDCARLCR